MKKLKAKLETGEGEWWMTYKDFLRCFTHLSICHLQPEDLGHMTSSWTEQSVHGEWVPGGSAGGCGNDGITKFLTNPQYLLRVSGEAGKVEVSMALMQKGRRQLRDEMGVNTFLAIGITVFPIRMKINKRVSRKHLKGVSPMGMEYEDSRTTTMQVILPVGDYLVIPASFYMDQEGAFSLRVAAKDKNFQLIELI